MRCINEVAVKTCLRSVRSKESGVCKFADGKAAIWHGASLNVRACGVTQLLGEKCEIRKLSVRWYTYTHTQHGNPLSAIRPMGWARARARSFRCLAHCRVCNDANHSNEHFCGESVKSTEIVKITYSIYFQIKSLRFIFNP